MNPLENGKVLYTVYEGDRQVIKEHTLTAGERLILETMDEHEYTLDIFWAYLAEMYPECPEAPSWRRRSGTTNGILVSRYLRAIPNDRHGYSVWRRWIRERFFRRFDDVVEAPGDDVCEEAMAMVLWLNQIVFVEHEAWVPFVQASRRTLRYKPSKEARLREQEALSA